MWDKFIVKILQNPSLNPLPFRETLLFIPFKKNVSKFNAGLDLSLYSHKLIRENMLCYWNNSRRRKRSKFIDRLLQ